MKEHKYRGLVLLLIAVVLALVYAYQSFELVASPQEGNVIAKENTTRTTATATSTNHTGDMEAVVSSSNATIISTSQGYLQYFIQGGWGNQIQCIVHAYYLARAANRTLVLAPVAPHLHFHFRDIYYKNSGFSLGYDLPKHYLHHKLPSNKYLRLDRILDLQASLPEIETVDFREFYETHNITEQDIWVVESNYTHFNTIWTVNQPHLLGSYESVTAREHNHDVSYNQSYRDVHKTANKLHQTKKPMWTLLDSFRTATEHSSLRYEPTFQPRYSSTIHDISNRIREKDFHQIPYAAVHIRGSDGPFKSTEAIHQAIAASIDGILPQIQSWMIATSAASSRNNQTIGLFIATDLIDLPQNGFFQFKLDELKGSIHHAKHNSSLLFQVWYSFDLVARVQELLPEPNYLGEEPSIFIDQQLAACAEIGFFGTPNSSFSRLISILRQDNSTEGFRS